MKKIMRIAQIVSSLMGVFMLMFMKMFEMSTELENKGLRVSIAVKNASVLDNALNSDPAVDQSLIALVKLCGLALIVAAVVSLVLAVLKLAANNVGALQKLAASKLTMLAPAASVVLAFAFMILAADYPFSSTNGSVIYYVNTPTASFYFCIVCLLVTLTLDWYGFSKKASEE